MYKTINENEWTFLRWNALHITTVVEEKSFHAVRIQEKIKPYPLSWFELKQN